MTRSIAEQPTVADRLRAARQRAGLTLDEASRATGLLRSYVAALEEGRRRPLPREVERLGLAYGADLSDLLPVRRPVTVDAGHMSMGGRSHRLQDAANDREVYAAYLFLLYAVRGAAPGEHIPLRASDVALLMQVVGKDAESIERRLVQLMGCTPDEAVKLRSVLLRHRAATATAAVGASAALSWVAVAVPGPASDVPTPVGVHATTPLSGGNAEASYFELDVVDGVVAPPAEDVVDGTWSPTYPSGQGTDADA